MPVSKRVPNQEAESHLAGTWRLTLAFKAGAMSHSQEDEMKGQTLISEAWYPFSKSLPSSQLWFPLPGLHNPISHLPLWPSH